MTINSTQKKILQVLWDNQESNSNKSFTEKEKRIYNVSLRKQAQILQSILPKIKIESTENEHIEEKLENNETEYLYKEWEITLSDFASVEPEILIDFIIPYVKYDIVYESGGELDIDFYNNELDLQQTSFWEIKNDLLILHVSIYMKRYYNSEQLISPQGKLIINFKNPLTFLT